MPNANQVNLNTILGKLDPQTLTDMFLINHDLSRRKYPVGNIKVSSYKEFVAKITRFYIYHHKNIFSGVAMPEDLAWSQAMAILESGFGDLRAAYATAHTGMENGIEACYDKIYQRLRKNHIDAFTKCILTTDINPMNFSEIVELMRQLKQRFSSGIPQNYNIISVYEMASDYQNFIKMYIENNTSIRLRLAN